MYLVHLHIDAEQTLSIRQLNAIILIIKNSNQNNFEFCIVLQKS